LDTKTEVVAVLKNVLGLKDRANQLALDTQLLGAIPELDSMAVASVLTSLEDRFGFMIFDDEIDGSAFATVGTLVEFVDRKLAK
jgi:acyl carrier protein